MSSQVLDPMNDEHSWDDDDLGSGMYRAVSKGAVAALLLALLAPLGWLWPSLLILPLVGTFVGFFAWSRVRRSPDELTGGGIALVGTLGCGMLFLVISSYKVFEYVTEVPDGFSRLAWAQLQSPVDLPGLGDTKLPEEVKQLDGTNVFVAGYVHPGVAGFGRVKNFVIVPDMKTCCFGGQPKLTDMIDVTVTGNHPGIEYSRRKRKFAGVLHVHDHLRKAPGDITAGYYSLDANLVK